MKKRFRIYVAPLKTTLLQIDSSEDEELGEKLSSLVPRKNELVTLKDKTYKVINIEYYFIETPFVKDSLQEVHVFLEKI